MKRIIFSLLLCSQISAQDLTSDLVICMPMDGNANDLSGNNNNGFVYNIVSTSDRFNIPNSALQFNGSNSKIVVPSSLSISNIETVNELTISVWCKISSFGSTNCFPVANKYKSGTFYGGWDYTIQPPSTWNGQIFVPNYAGMGSNYGICKGNEGVTLNQWDFYAITFSRQSSTFKVYKNGTLLNSVNTGVYTLDTTSTGSLYIGCSPGATMDYANGFIDDFKMYSRALTQAEIQTLYNNSSSCTAASIKEIQTSISAFYLLNNPTTDHVNITCKDENTNLGDIKIIVYSNDGKIVKEESFPSGQNEFNVNVQDLSSGFYHINVSDKKHSQNLKFIKN